jgi:hypothetical protein
MFFQPSAVGEEAGVPDAMQTLRQDVHQAAPDELGRIERHGRVAAGPLDAIILELEGDTCLVGGDEAPIGDGDAMGIAREIGEDGLRAGERLFAVDEAVGLADWRTAWNASGAARWE